MLRRFTGIILVHFTVVPSPKFYQIFIYQCDYKEKHETDIQTEVKMVRKRDLEDEDFLEK